MELRELPWSSLTPLYGKKVPLFISSFTLAMCSIWRKLFLKEKDYHDWNRMIWCFVVDSHDPHRVTGVRRNLIWLVDVPGRHICPLSGVFCCWECCSSINDGDCMKFMRYHFLGSFALHFQLPWTTAVNVHYTKQDSSLFQPNGNLSYWFRYKNVCH